MIELNDIEKKFEENYMNDLIYNRPKSEEKRISDEKRHAKNLKTGLKDLGIRVVDLHELLEMDFTENKGV